jgi:hypothetical protein
LIADGSDKSTIEGGTFMEDGDPTGESSSVYSYQRRKPLPSSISLPRVRREERKIVGHDGGHWPARIFAYLGGRDDFAVASVAACLRTPLAIRCKSRGNYVDL